MKTIRIPVFTTKISEEENSLFDINERRMVEEVCDKINRYKCSSLNKITISNEAKNYTTEVVSIEAKEKTIGVTPIVLIRMSMHKTNWRDGYIESDKKVDITKNTKIGSDHHYIIMYPMVKKGKSKYKTYWNVFIYDDPNKESYEFIRSTKYVLKEVLNEKISNLKKKDFVEEMRVYKIIPNITATFNTVEVGSNQYDIEFKDYFHGCKIYSKAEQLFKNMPPDKLQELINNDSDDSIKRKVFGIFVGKREYKLTKTIKKDYKTAKERYTLLIESHFNESIEVSDDELKSEVLYDEQFVINKISSVAANYMS